MNILPKHSSLPPSFLTKLARTPHILAKALQGLKRKHMDVEKDYKRDDGISEPLTQISIKITNMCNLRCKMCGQWGEKGYNHEKLEKAREELQKVVPLEVYKKMIDDVAHLKPIIYIWGGEPFLYPDLMPLTSYMKEKGCTLSLVTNGIKLEESAEEIVKNQWDALMLSLDGTKEIHNEIRGSQKCFDTLARGIEKIQKVKKDKKSLLPYVMLLVTVSRDNAGILDKIFDIGQELGADCMVVYYAWFTNEKAGEKHTEIFQKYLDCNPTAWKSYVQPVNEIDIEALKEAIHRIKSKKYSFPYLFIPDLKEDQLNTYYNEADNFMGYGRCVTPWITAEIMANGDVSPCRDFPDYICGNITETPILEIYNNEKYRKFRQVLKQCGGTFPICSRCCGLMGW